MGTWTGAAGPTGETATGTWTVIDAQGRTLGQGGWSAAKSPVGWKGTWRAIVTGSKKEYSGTWSAGVNLETTARFPDLFEAAVQGVVSGTWRTGGQSGAWSIRAFK